MSMSRMLLQKVLLNYMMCGEINILLPSVHTHTGRDNTDLQVSIQIDVY